ncbi:hypothetical protein Q3W71_18475 [Micromonospora sp. C28SCA-DRY-2]|uniref:hypothetical protein n=1 Tax=Micromonospora sp. C28SCA-DRY-2 TaxID=3059522 RepID=UPI00267482DA|nr:hypothetical protein [Micromonospora sp. C28SCA-DRY-2]MDO3703653.1 hypothetical protein [Micromonospora sp. C28SCA-DRY-2]
MTRLGRIVAVPLVAVGLLAACGDGSTPAVTPSTASAPAGTPSNAAPSSAGPLSIDQAIARFVAERYGPDVRYVGRCAVVEPGTRGVCALPKATVDGGEVYGIGAPFSEIDAFLLLDDNAGDWRVVDSYVPDFPSDGSSTGPVPAWFAQVD